MSDFRRRLLVQLKRFPDVVLSTNEYLIEKFAARANRWHEISGVYFCPWEKVTDHLPTCECLCEKAVEEAVKDGISKCGLLKAKKDLSLSEKIRTKLHTLKRLKRLKNSE